MIDTVAIPNTLKFDLVGSLVSRKDIIDHITSQSVRGILHYAVTEFDFSTMDA